MMLQDLRTPRTQLPGQRNHLRTPPDPRTNGTELIGSADGPAPWTRDEVEWGLVLHSDQEALQP